MLLRILQVLTVLPIVPTMCIGLMVAMSGGSTTTPFYSIGMRLLVLSPLVAIVSLGVPLLLERKDMTLFAYIILAVPFALWAYLLIDLQNKTGFFS
ncbi:MAG: hypothetical protein AAFV93_07765 [Chloroflexota bacterium]